jgi:uncharacterized protein YdeI (BOF family)
MPNSAQQFGYDSARIPLVGNHTNRLASPTKDQIFYNVIPESIKNEIGENKKIWLNKRGGVVSNLAVIGSGAGRGIYYWPESGKTYTVIANKIYENAVEKYTLTTSTGTCWFAEFKGTNHLLVVGDGVDLVYITTAGVVTDISDGDLPAGPITPVFFDSYIFVIKSGTPEIYNSVVDDPTSWDAGDFISAEQYADDLVALIRHVNYVVAFGLYSVEFLFDAENATGSPLERNESVSLKVGLAARDSIAQVDRRIFFVGQTQTGEPSAWMYDGLTPKEVSNEMVRKILAAEGSSLASAKAYIISHKGHTLYILNLSSRTIVYDVDEKMWCDWSINSGGSHAVFPFNYASEGPNNTILLLHNTNGTVYNLDPATHTDTGFGSILVSITTDRVDFDTDNFKHQGSLSLICDSQTSGTVSIDWSDDDYLTYSTARTLDLTAARSYTKAGGAFRRRVYRLQHSTNAPFRAEALELTYQRRVN